MHPLVKLRSHREISQLQLANELKVSQSTISKIESGERRPSPKVAEKIRETFHLTHQQIWEMFYGEGEGRATG